MLTQYDREMQQSSTFLIRSQDDKKIGEVWKERERKKNPPSLTSQFMSSFRQAVTMRKCCEVTEVSEKESYYSSRT